MPRKARLSIPGAVHHVMSRGIEGRNIFSDEEDKNTFLEMLGLGIRKSGFLCYAWVLMDNHYHIVIRPNDLPLSALFKPLHSRYARYFSKKQGRRGYLFQDRFKSLATQDQGYLEEMIRYVHLNPIRAGIVGSLQELDRYPWSGHATLVGNIHRDFQTTGMILKRFGATREDGISRYKAFMRKGMEQSHVHDFLVHLRSANQSKENRFDPGCWVIGDPVFVRNALAESNERNLRIARYHEQGWTLDRLNATIGKKLGVKKEEIHRRGRKNGRSEFRKIFSAIAHRQLGIPVVEIARYLNISGAAVSKSLDYGEKIANERVIDIVI